MWLKLTTWSTSPGQYVRKHEILRNKRGFFTIGGTCGLIWWSSSNLTFSGLEPEGGNPRWCMSVVSDCREIHRFIPPCLATPMPSFPYRICVCRPRNREHLAEITPSHHTPHEKGHFARVTTDLDKRCVKSESWNLILNFWLASAIETTKPKSLVIVDQHATVNVPDKPCIHCQSGPKTSLEPNVCFVFRTNQITESWTLGLVLGSSLNKVIVRELAIGRFNQLARMIKARSQISVNICSTFAKTGWCLGRASQCLADVFCLRAYFGPSGQNVSSFCPLWRLGFTMYRMKNHAFGKSISFRSPTFRFLYCFCWVEKRHPSKSVWRINRGSLVSQEKSRCCSNEPSLMGRLGFSSLIERRERVQYDSGEVPWGKI